MSSFVIVLGAIADLSDALDLCYRHTGILQSRVVPTFELYRLYFREPAPKGM